MKNLILSLQCYRWLYWEIYHQIYREQKNLFGFSTYDIDTKCFPLEMGHIPFYEGLW